MQMLPVNFKKLSKTATTPTLATKGAAAFDLYADLEQLDAATASLPPESQMVIGTGIALEMYPGTCAIIIPRSGLGVKSGIIIGNGTGLIDSDYRGEVKVCLWNRSKEDPTRYNQAFELKHGDRIAQLMFLQIPQVTLYEVEELAPTDRGEGGFGSTGVR